MPQSAHRTIKRLSCRFRTGTCRSAWQSGHEMNRSSDSFHLKECGAVSSISSCIATEGSGTHSIGGRENSGPCDLLSHCMQNHFSRSHGPLHFRLGYLHPPVVRTKVLTLNRIKSAKQCVN